MVYRVFVSNLPSSINEYEIQKLFCNCGEIKEIELTPLHKSAVAIIVFKKYADAVKGVNKRNNFEYDGFPLKVHNCYQVVVSNLPPQCTWRDLRNHFTSKKVDDILFIDVEVGREGVAEFSSELDAQRAVEILNGTELTTRRGNSSIIRVAAVENQPSMLGKRTYTISSINVSIGIACLNR
jgi:RNA recognition motif-containing protein